MCVSVYMIFTMKYYNMYKHFFKRFIDFSVALVALSILLVPMVVVTLWLHFANKGSGAFFFQERPGKDGKIFKIAKFKTRLLWTAAVHSLYFENLIIYDSP